MEMSYECMTICKNPTCADKRLVKSFSTLDYRISMTKLALSSLEEVVRNWASIRIRKKDAKHNYNLNAFIRSQSATMTTVAHPGEGSGGPGPPIFLDQTKAWRAEKNFSWDQSPLPPPPSPPPPYLKVWIRCWTIHKECFFPLSVDLTHTKHDRWSLGKAL